MKNKEKKDVLYEYIKTIKKSWTYELLTKQEEETLEHIFLSEQIKDTLKGNQNKEQIYKNLNMIYSSFLAGLGYDGYNWREKHKQPLF